MSASLEKLSPERFKTSVILKKQALAGSKLAELKGVAWRPFLIKISSSISWVCKKPDSSAIDNMMTSNDELFKGELFPENLTSPAVRKVLRYWKMLRLGFEQVSWSGSLTTKHIIQIQAALEQDNKPSGTIYTPEIFIGFEHFINDNRFAADPLIKMALLHPLFVNAHPLYSRLIDKPGVSSISSIWSKKAC